MKIMLDKILNKEYSNISEEDIFILNEERMRIETKKIFGQKVSKEENKTLNKINLIFENTIDKEEFSNNNFIDDSDVLLEAFEAMLEGDIDKVNSILDDIGK